MTEQIRRYAVNFIIYIYFGILWFRYKSYKRFPSIIDLLDPALFKSKFLSNLLIRHSRFAFLHIHCKRNTIRYAVNNHDINLRESFANSKNILYQHTSIHIFSEMSIFLQILSFQGFHISTLFH